MQDRCRGAGKRDRLQSHFDSTIPAQQHQELYREEVLTNNVIPHAHQQALYSSIYKTILKKHDITYPRVLSDFPNQIL